MQHIKRAYQIDTSGYMRPEAFGAFCQDCDEEILGNDPMFYDPDGDYDENGKAVDASTYLCQVCGVARGYEVPR